MPNANIGKHFNAHARRQACLFQFKQSLPEGVFGRMIASPGRVKFVHQQTKRKRKRKKRHGKKQRRQRFYVERFVSRVSEGSPHVPGGENGKYKKKVCFLFIFDCGCAHSRFDYALPVISVDSDRLVPVSSYPTVGGGKCQPRGDIRRL